jgi:dTDP-4-amino-4,6-dideoxygalactose transaminase
MEISFTKPRQTQNERKYINHVLDSGKTWGGGEYSKQCSAWMSKTLGTHRALLTNSATDALEMAALLLEIKPGDEIIMPSFTFVSTANAFVLRGGIPVFVDVDANTLNIDVNLIEAAISEKTKAVLIMNYAGVSCDIEKVQNLTKKYGLFLIEDAAQSILAKYRDKFLGTFGDLSCISFHGTKNISCGEGGALLINNPIFIEKAEIILEKGTNRSKFIKGETDKYTWVDLGSSFLASEVAAAYLYAQLEEAHLINELRKNYWNGYNNFFTQFSEKFNLKLFRPENFSTHNGHIFYLILQDTNAAEQFISSMSNMKIHCYRHYVPLHNAPAAGKFGKIGSTMSVTNDLSKKLVRLPIWSENGLPLDEILGNSYTTLRNLK